MMFEEMLYLQLQQETGGNHPASLTTPAVHMHGPAETNATATSVEEKKTPKRRKMCCTLGEGSFSTTVIRESGGKPPEAESGIKEDQYPYRTLFSVLFTTASRHCSAP